MRMRTWKPTVLLIGGMLLFPWGASAAPADVEALLRVMPGDVPVSAVIVNMEKLDKSVGAAVKSISPEATYGGMLADIKDDLAIAKWVDFTKPVGMTQANIMGGGEPVLWAIVPDFNEKVKTVAAAKEENGVWQLPFEGDKTIYVKVKGAYVAAATDGGTLASALKEGKSLADELKAQMDLFKDRDALIHVNFEPIRPMATMSLMQASQMAPMLGMMAAQGGDPAAMTALLGALIDGVKKFVEQVAFLDIAVGVGETTGVITLAAGFKDGDIKNYLVRQKPASVPLLAEIEEQPYFVALGCHVPGTESPFFDYFYDKLSAALTAPAPGAAPGTPPTQDLAATQTVKDAFGVSRDLYRKVEGWNAVIAFTGGGMRVGGDYIGHDPAAILDLAKQSITTANPMMKNFSGGASYEALGPTKVGDVTVEQFAIKFDTTNPAAAQAAQMMGENTRFFLGVVGGRVRYCMGTFEDAKRVFSSKVEKPLASNKQVAEAIAALPAKRNVIVLVDPSGVLPLIGPMMGMPKTEPLPPGPPVSISVSISAEPARVDVHVPFRAIGRIVQALKPQQPT